jgi:hypothetical protein
MKTIAAIIGVLVFFIITPLYAQTVSVGKFTKVEGRIDVTRPGREARTVHVGDPLYQKDIIRAKSRSKAEILFSDGNVLRLAQNTRVEISEYIAGTGKTSAIIKLFRGKIQNKVKKLFGRIFGKRKNRYEVHTPTSVCGVRGTNFFTFHQKGISGSMFKEGYGYGYSINRPNDVREIGTGHAMLVTNPDLPPVIRPATKNELMQLEVDTRPSNGREDENDDGDTQNNQNGNEGERPEGIEENENGMGGDEGIEEENEEGSGEREGDRGEGDQREEKEHFVDPENENMADHELEDDRPMESNEGDREPGEYSQENMEPTENFPGEQEKEDFVPNESGPEEHEPLEFGPDEREPGDPDHENIEPVDMEPGEHDPADFGAGDREPEAGFFPGDREPADQTLDGEGPVDYGPGDHIEYGLEESRPAENGPDDPMMNGDPMITGDPMLDGDPMMVEDPMIDGDVMINEDPMFDGDIMINEDPMFDGDPLLTSDPFITGDPFLTGDPLINDPIDEPFYDPYIDPATGYRIDPATGYLIDPETGYLIDPATEFFIDPATGHFIDPATGNFIDPVTGDMIDPATGYVIDPITGYLIDPVTGNFIDPLNGDMIDPATGNFIDPVTGDMVDPATGYVIDPITGYLIHPVTNHLIDPNYSIPRYVPPESATDTAMPFDVHSVIIDGTVNQDGTYTMDVSGTFDLDTYHIPPFDKLFEIDGQMTAGIGPLSESYYRGFVAGLWHHDTVNKIDGDARLLYVAPDGSAGIFENPLTGDFSDAGEWALWTDLKHVELVGSNSLSHGPIILDMRYLALDNTGINAGYTDTGGTLSVSDIHTTQVSIAYQDWGIWDMGLDGTYTTYIDPPDGIWYTELTDTSDDASGSVSRYLQVHGDLWSNETIEGDVSGGWVDLNDMVPMAGVLGGKLNGGFDPTTTIMTWQAGAGGAWIETGDFLALASTATGKIKLNQLNIPCYEIGKANLAGESGIMSISMTDVTFFSSSVGGPPKIWATDNVGGYLFYSSVPPDIGHMVNLTGGYGSLYADFTIEKWDNGVWKAKVNGYGTYDIPQDPMYNTQIDMRGGAAGTYNGNGDLTGTAAGAVREIPPP